MPVLRSGAQRASHPSRIGGAAVVALVAAALVAPVASAAEPVTTATVTTTTVSAPWLSDEAYYLKLLNCTRTGGWVLKDGTCRGYGSGRYSAYVKPLTRSPGISDRVSRPYAKLLAVKNACSHFLDHDPGYRLRRAGFSGYNWGENIGCRNGSSVRASILASHLYFQSEKATNGGHWRNIKNPRYTYVGIGIWRYGDRVRLVTDFYRP